MKTCKTCKKEFTSIRSDKKFCSGRCRARYNTRLNYLAVGQTKKYKKIAKKRFAAWLIKNKKKHNEAMKNYIKRVSKTPEYRAKQREYYRKNKDKINKRNRKNKKLKQLQND